MRRAIVGGVLVVGALGAIVFGLQQVAGPGSEGVFGSSASERARVELPDGGSVVYLQLGGDPGDDENEAVLRRLDAEGDTRWEVPVFRIRSSELHVGGGVAVLTFRDRGGDAASMMAMELDEGEERWRKVSLPSPEEWEYFGRVFAHQLIAAEPCLGEVLPTRPSLLRCVDLDSGSERWRVRLPRLEPSSDEWPWARASVHWEGERFVARDMVRRSIVAVSADEGERRELVPAGSTGCLAGEHLVLLDAEGRLTLHRGETTVGTVLEPGPGVVGECRVVGERLAVAWATSLEEEFQRRVDGGAATFPAPVRVGSLDSPMTRGGALLLLDTESGQLEAAFPLPWGLVHFEDTPTDAAAEVDAWITAEELPYLIHDEVGYADAHESHFELRGLDLVPAS